MAYQTNRDAFLTKLEDAGKTQFIKYFRDNWDNITDKWVSYLRKDCIHLGNNTNNRIESGWGKLKLSLDRYTPLDEAIGKLYNFNTSLTTNVCEI
jgi:hypothetical protein